MAMDPNYLAAVVGVNASVLVAVAVEWRGAVAAAREKADRGEGQKAARLAVLFAGISCFVTLVGLAVETWAMMPAGAILLTLTAGALASLYVLFFPMDAARFRRWTTR